MNVLLANNYFYLRGGSERVLIEEKRILEENGNKVAVFSQSHPENEYSEYGYFIPKTTAYEHMTLSGKVRTAVNMVYDRGVGKACRKVLEEFRPDLVHAHNIYGTLTTAILDEARRLNIPSVMTLHDTKLICPSYLSLNHGVACEDCRGQRFYHCLLNRCHKDSLVASAIYTVESYYNKWFGKYDSLRFLICPSRFLYDRMMANGFSADRLVHLPNFVDTADFAPSSDTGEYVLYVGRLSREKGVLTLINAVAEIGVPLFIVGDGPVRKEAENVVREEGLKNIAFKGYCNGEKLRRLFKNAAFLVIPSECYENAPMTVLEAYAYGKPAIGSQIGGIPEIIEHYRTGMLFKPGRDDQLRECIKELWSNKSMITEMGSNARQKVQSDFSPEFHYEILSKIYSNAIM